MSTEQRHTDTTPQTTRQSYQHIRDTADDVALRKRVAAAIALSPSTTMETTQALSDASRNAVRPRINELIRMGCIEREGKRTNPSGMSAYVHHITETGERYLAGDVDPEPNPPLSELQAKVVETARAMCAGEATTDDLQERVEAHDSAKQKRNPEWEPPHTFGPTLTDEQRKKIKADPVLSLSDYE